MEDSEIIERAEKWIPRAKAFWEPHHQRFTRIKTFVKNHGDHAQWEDGEYADRQNQTPPRLTLTENLLGPFSNQVANDLKQSDFGAIVKPKDSGTDVELAEVRQGLHRGVQQIGGFKNTLARAIDDLVDGGLGAWRFITRYADPMSLNKEIKYLECDPTRLFHGDGTHREANFSDVTDSLYYEPYGKERFKAEFDEDPDNFLGAADCSPVWGTQTQGPWVSEYFFKEESPETLVKVTKDPQVQALLQFAKVRPDGTYYLSDLKDKLKEITTSSGIKAEDFIAKDADGNPITRPTTRCQIWWAKLAHKQVLKKEKWPGYFIPNFLATGRKVVINGDVKYYGLCEPAVHVQKAHNYAFSALVERAGQAPKSQLMMPIEGMDPKYQSIYDNIAVWNGIVPFKSWDKDNKRAIERPYKESPIQSDPAFVNLRQMTLQGIRDVLGMWETSLGAQSNEKSGVAIKARERQSDTNNFDWGASLAVAAEHCFVATDEVLSKVIDVATQVRIVGEDEKDKVIWAASLEEGDPNHDGYFDLNRGKFHILCKMGPSSDTKRDAQVEGMEMLFKNNPALASGLAPEYIAVQDWKNAAAMAEIAKKIRATQFPNVQFEDGPAQIPPEAQQHINQMQQQMQAMQQQLQEAQQAGQKAQSLQIENQSIKANKQLEMQRLQIDQFKADTERMLAQAQTGKIQGDMLLKQDDQQHRQLQDNAQIVHDTNLDKHRMAQDAQAAKADAQDQAHQHAKNIATIGINIQSQQHQEAMDHGKLDLENRKADQAKEIAAAKAASEPAQPGTSPTRGVKP